MAETHKKKPKLYTYINTISTTILVLGLLSLRYSEFVFSKTVHPQKFILLNLLYGLILSALLLVLLYRRFPFYYKNMGENNARALLGLLVGMPMLYLAGSAFYDTQHLEHQGYVRTQLISKSEPPYPHRYLLKIALHDDTLKLRVTRQKYESMHTPDSVQLSLSRGRLGLEHITDIHLLAPADSLAQ